MPDSYQEAQTAVGAISDFANRWSGATARHCFATRMCHGTHRTLQQGSFALMLACIDQWAKDADAGNFDLRNEETVKMAKQIVESFGEEWKYKVNLPVI